MSWLVLCSVAAEILIPMLYMHMQSQSRQKKESLNFVLPIIADEDILCSVQHRDIYCSCKR